MASLIVDKKCVCDRGGEETKTRVKDRHDKKQNNEKQ